MHVVLRVRSRFLVLHSVDSRLRLACKRVLLSFHWAVRCSRYHLMLAGAYCCGDPGVGGVCRHLCAKTARIFNEEERVLRVPSPCYIFGDLHGNIQVG
jgi:hypothetical protein